MNWISISISAQRAGRTDGRIEGGTKENVRDDDGNDAHDDDDDDDRDGWSWSSRADADGNGNGNGHVDFSDDVSTPTTPREC